MVFKFGNKNIKGNRNGNHRKMLVLNDPKLVDIQPENAQTRNYGHLLSFPTS